MVGTRSICTAQLLVFFVCLIILVQIWIDNRKRYLGIGHWVSGMAATIAGFVLIALRDIVSDFWSILIANSLLLIGIILFLIGLTTFLKVKKNYRLNSIFIAVSIGLLAYFTYANPNIGARVIIVDMVYVLFFSQALWILFKKTSPEFYSITQPLKVNSAIFILLNLVRIINAIVHPPQTLDFFSQNIFEIIVLTLNILVLLYLIINLAMLVPKKLLSDVKKEENKFNTIFHSAPYGVSITRADDGKIIEINDEMLELMRYTKQEAIGKSIFELNTWEDVKQRNKIVKDLRAGKNINGIELKFNDKNNSVVHGLFSAVLVNMGGEEYVISTLKDISEINKLKEELKNMATHDGLTKLPNRLRFYEYFEKQAAHASRTGEELAVVMADIDSFKTVNDEYGHDMGDKVLIAVANRLNGSIRKGDLAARFGGDEFALLLNVRDMNETELVISRLQQIFNEDVIVGDIQFDISLSIGVSIYPKDATEIDELLKRADEAMMEVKKSTKNAVRFAKK